LVECVKKIISSEAPKLRQWNLFLDDEDEKGGNTFTDVQKSPHAGLAKTNRHRYFVPAFVDSTKRQGQ
jgi:hypothetical protein